MNYFPAHTPCETQGHWGIVSPMTMNSPSANGFSFQGRRPVLCRFSFLCFSPRRKPKTRFRSKEPTPPAAMGRSYRPWLNPAVKDAQSRPITAGGFVEKGAGLCFWISLKRLASTNFFPLLPARQEKKTILENEWAPGVALLDYEQRWLARHLHPEMARPSMQ